MTTQHSDALRSSGRRNSHHFLSLSFADFSFPSPLLLTLPHGGNHFSSGTMIHLYPGDKYNQKTGSRWLSLWAWPPWRRRKSHFGLKSLTHSPIKLYRQSSWNLSFIWFSSLVQTLWAGFGLWREKTLLGFMHQSLLCTLNNSIEAFSFYFYL